ncbi:1-phosphatidylinositol-3-phosphate 5-kinase [Coprinopsis cinerea AmutBmut pab1-1]|nr:1-phosphatidylinositol-3-phosphate 5-kinase [Coprinopsis cinerea AmutBmut pab1-1]
MVNDKPLPEPPRSETSPIRSNAPPVLTTDARFHRGRLLKHILDDIPEQGVQSKKEQWISAFEDALDELGQAMIKGEWLSGLRLGRLAMDSARQSRLKSNPVEQKQGEPEATNEQHVFPSISEDLKPLERLQQLVNNRPTTESGDLPRHLVVCVSPHGSRRPIPEEDSGFDIIPANIDCTFTEGSFTFQPDGSNVLVGLQEWEDISPVEIVGGTFTFKGLTSPRQHHTLSRALRLAVYIQTSLILEQSLLKDLNVPLTYPKARARVASTSTPMRQMSLGPEHDPTTRARGSLLPGGFLGLFSRKSISRLARSNTVARSDSTDPESQGTSPTREHFIRSSFDPGSVFRRLSLLGDRGASARRALETVAENDPPFASAVKRIQASRSCLSTSSGVVFDPPMLLVYLSEKEKLHPKRRLKGDEKVGLGSILGWDGREARGRGMSGITGFVRQQEISILYSSHTPPAPPAVVPPAAEENSLTTPATRSNLPQSGLKLCGRPHWVTYQFFSRDPSSDQTLGNALSDFIATADLPCERSGCPYKRGQHELRLIHGGTQVVVRIDSSKPSENPEGIESWETCAVCQASTPRGPLSDASWLFSFGKFLEVLIYSPLVQNITPTICPHTSVPSRTLSDLRFNIIRNFATSQGSISFSLSSVEDIFELRVPRIQISKLAERISRTPTESSVTSLELPSTEDEKKALRKEIRRWWEGVSDHIDSLEEILSDPDTRQNPRHKSLPRLPSADDAYDVFEGDPSSVPLPPATAVTPAPVVPSPQGDYFGSHISEAKTDATGESVSSGGSESTVTTPAVGPSIPPKDDSAQRLAALRQYLQRLEQSLYIQLANTPLSSLNDVRRSFLSAAKGTQKRLAAWQKKHLGSKVSMVRQLEGNEPEWWKKGCHAVPGANIIVREDDWGSIIAFTLSTADYHNELTNLSFNRPPLRTSASESSIPSSTGAPSSFFSVASGYKFFSPTIQPDPDQDDDAAWNEQESYSAIITRKEHIRDPTSILSIRDVLRKANPPADSVSVKSATATPSSSQSTPTTRAKPDVGLNMQAVGGQVLAGNESVEKLLQELEHLPTSRPPSRPPSVLESDTPSPSLTPVPKEDRGSTSSDSTGQESDTTIGANGNAQPSTSTDAPAVPQKEPPKPPPKDEPPAPPPKTPPTAASSFFASTFASTFGSAVRYVMSSAEPSRPTSPIPPGKHHTLLNADFETIDDRPHIKYDWTIGKRLKFSCTVYYAKQFDLLRKRCGIDDIYVKSLSRSANWAADGGKSKSNFWKTSDDRFIIKTLVNAWNVADLQFLIELAPAYFRYMDSTANKATALAKMLGFYTIEIRNLETGAVQSKVDLLVMENLFYDQQITKTFDLKGIQGRKVKTTNKAGGTTKTLFDGEWIEDQQRTLMLVRPHSKRVLREAIRSDAEFLAKCNIMDYSLLLGIDEGKKQISCGLVDTIGSYTFAKTLEYKAKHLQSGKDVTVIPPADYQERFVHALEGYFVACPDKWSKPMDESKIISDPDLLPSAL